MVSVARGGRVLPALPSALCVGCYRLLSDGERVAGNRIPLPSEERPTAFEIAKTDQGNMSCAEIRSLTGLSAVAHTGPGNVPSTLYGPTRRVTLVSHSRDPELEHGGHGRPKWDHHLNVGGPRTGQQHAPHQDRAAAHLFAHYGRTPLTVNRKTVHTVTGRVLCSPSLSTVGTPAVFSYSTLQLSRQ